MYVCMCIYIYIYTYMYIYIYIYIYIHTYTYTCMHVHIRIHVHIHIHTRIRIRIHIHTHIHSRARRLCAFFRARPKRASAACSNGISLVSVFRVRQTTHTFPVDALRSRPMDAQWHLPMSVPFVTSDV